MFRRGEHVDNLTDIAERDGIPAGFAGPWELPTATGVQAISPGEAPAASAPAQPTNPKIQTHPVVTAPTGDATKPPATGGN